MKLSVSRGMHTPRKEAFPEFLTPQQYADYLWLRSINDTGAPPQSDQYGNGSSPVLPDYLTPAGTSGTVDESAYQLVAGADNFPIKRANKAGTDWANEVFVSAPTTNVDFSASNATEGGSYYLSANYSSNNGILKHTSFDRYSLRANTNFKVKDFFNLGESFTFVYSERKGISGFQEEGGPIMQVHRIMPIIPVYDIQGNFAGTAGGGLGNGSNPLANLYRNRNDIRKTIRGIGSVFAEVDIWKVFKFKSTVGVDFASFTATDFTPMRLEDAEQNTFNRLTETSEVNAEVTFNNVLNFKKTFGEHSITALVGTEYNTRNYRQVQTYRNDFATDALDLLK